MSEKNTSQKYPYMSPKLFATLRTRLRQSRPTVITVDWLASVLNVSTKGAANTFPQLKYMGLLNPDGGLSPIADDLRLDDSYAKACQEIIEATYPLSLREAFHDPSADLAPVTAWFMRNAGTGEISAERQARLYLYLLSGESIEPATASNGAPKKAAPAKKAAAAKKSEPAKTTVKAAAEDHQGNNNPERLAPNLHIDVQIHISADAGDEQIEAIFSSMAKHLYGR